MIRSPRKTRPHDIVIKTYIGKIDGDAVYKETYLEHVSVDLSYGLKQSQKGLQADGDIKVVIDINDLVSTFDYVEPAVFQNAKDKCDIFTIQINDLILFKEKEYTINNVSGIGLSSTSFLQVVANE